MWQQSEFWLGEIFAVCTNQRGRCDSQCAPTGSEVTAGRPQTSARINSWTVAQRHIDIIITVTSCRTATCRSSISLQNVFISRQTNFIGYLSNYMHSFHGAAIPHFHLQSHCFPPASPDNIKAQASVQTAGCYLYQVNSFLQVLKGNVSTGSESNVSPGFNPSEMFLLLHHTTLTSAR